MDLYRWQRWPDGCERCGDDSVYVFSQPLTEDDEEWWEFKDDVWVWEGDVGVCIHCGDQKVAIISDNDFGEVWSKEDYDDWRAQYLEHISSINPHPGHPA